MLKLIYKLQGRIDNTAMGGDRAIGEHYDEYVRTLGPVEFILHINDISSTTAIRAFGYSLLEIYETQGSSCLYTPLVYWSWDCVTGRILRLFGRTVWSSPTQED